LSSRLDHIQGSGVRRMFDLIRTMKDPINLSIGQAHYEAPPEAIEAATAAMRHGENRYTTTQGIPELIQRVSDRLEGRYGFRPPSVFMTSGVSGGLLLAHLSLFDPGDEILLPDPYFVMYTNMLELVGAKAAFYETYPSDDPKDGRAAWHPDLAEIEARITDKTRAILINSPSNPTGGMLDRNELQGLAALARKHDLWILSDEIYSHFHYGRSFESMITRMPDHEKTIVFGGFSKTYGMPGWRLGFVAGPEDALEAMKTIQQYTFVCAPAPLQYGALAAMSIDVSRYRDEYEQKRDLVYEQLHDLYPMVPSEGSFYAFPAYPQGMSEEVFIERCLERRLLIVPGSAFSRRATHFRLSFAASDEMLREGLRVLREFVTE
ncbi:MAG: pyridoxal phosphate-dependent aminotransferase, partial [Planctomycetes bacterium]|nr:pyridoxal phosphate-dependent aminotransferase [Planctomycetota bacterium]